MLAFIQNIGPLELTIIFFVVLMLFGAKRLPSLFASFGQGVREFRKATSGIQDEVSDAFNGKQDSADTK